MINEIKTALGATDEEAQLIYELYEYTHELDETVELQFRHKNFLGVGDRNELLRFYLYPTKFHIKIKFKGGDKATTLNVKDAKKYKSEIKRVNDYFKNNILLLAETPKNKPDYQIFKKSRFEVLKTLAKGKDPVTNNKLFEPSKELQNILMNIALFVLQKDDINKKSFKVYRKYLEKIDHLTKTKTNAEGYENTSKPWTEKEDKALKAELKTMTIEEIAKLHKRSENAIKNRIVFFKKSK